MATTLKSYEEFRNEINRGFEESKNTLEQNKTAAIERAGNTKKESNVAAQNDFLRSQATYGQLAEQLSQAGLAGSGYSDNMTRDAYASRQEAYAASECTYADTLRDIDDSYNEKRLSLEDSHNQKLFEINEKERQAEQQKLNTYTDLLQTVDNSWSKEAIDSLGAGHGFNEDQMKGLYKSAGMSMDSGDYISRISGLTTSEDIVGDFNAILKDYKTNAFGIEGPELEDIKNRLNSMARRTDQNGDSYLSRVVADAGSKEEADRLVADWMDDQTRQALTAEIERKYGVVDNKKMVWDTNNLGYGFENHGFELYIDTLERDESKKVFAVLRNRVGKKDDSDLAKSLNEAATGDPNKDPGYYGGFGMFFGGDLSSEKKPGALVIYENKPYIYTQHGWFEVGGLSEADIQALKDTVK